MYSTRTPIAQLVSTGGSFELRVFRARCFSCSPMQVQGVPLVPCDLSAQAADVGSSARYWKATLSANKSGR